MPEPVFDGRSSRWDAHRSVRREQLLDAAVATINEHGADAGMEQIAAAAGTSKPVVYRYFADKDALYRAIGARVVTRILDAIAAVEADPDPQALLRTSIDAYLQLLEDNPRLFRFVTVHRVFNEVRADGPASGETHGSVSELLTRLLGDRLAAGGLDPAGAAPWGEAIVGFIRAASLWWLDHPQEMTRAGLTDYLTALLWGGAAGIYQFAGQAADPRPPAGVFVPLRRADQPASDPAQRATVPEEETRP